MYLWFNTDHQSIISCEWSSFFCLAYLLIGHVLRESRHQFVNANYHVHKQAKTKKKHGQTASASEVSKPALTYEIYSFGHRPGWEATGKMISNNFVFVMFVVGWMLLLGKLYAYMQWAWYAVSLNLAGYIPCVRVTIMFGRLMYYAVLCLCLQSIEIISFCGILEWYDVMVIAHILTYS